MNAGVERGGQRCDIEYRDIFIILSYIGLLSIFFYITQFYDSESFNLSMDLGILSNLINLWMFILHLVFLSNFIV